MKIKEVVEKAADMSDKDRTKYVAPMMKKLCKVSHATISNFQIDWDGSRPFEEFKKEQAKVIEECVKMEVSAAGKVVRETLGLEPLSMEDEV